MTQYIFSGGKILLTANDFVDTAILLQLHDGKYNFIKDTYKDNPLFMAGKDDSNVYILIGIIPGAINDTAVLTTIRYQAFDKTKQTHTSKVFQIEGITFPLRMIKSFEVDYDD